MADNRSRVTPLAMSAGTSQGARSVEIPAPAIGPMNRWALMSTSPTNSPTMTAIATCVRTSPSCRGTAFSDA